jgi:hypothetical protein
MNVVVFTSNKHNWCLKPFSILFNKYWGENQGVMIGGYEPPGFPLPNNFKFYQISPEEYGKGQWGDGVWKFFHDVGYEQALIMLEDYWICRHVDVEGMEILNGFLKHLGERCLRVDVTADRLYAGTMRDIGYWERFDIIQAPGSQYEMSLQAGMQELRREYRSAWDVELHGTGIVTSHDLNVYGTRQWPLRYCNGMNNAKGKKVILDALTKEDIDLIMPFIPEENR